MDVYQLIIDNTTPFWRGAFSASVVVGSFTSCAYWYWLRIHHGIFSQRLKMADEKADKADYERLKAESRADRLEKELCQIMHGILAANKEIFKINRQMEDLADKTDEMCKQTREAKEKQNELSQTVYRFGDDVLGLIDDIKQSREH